MKFLDEHSMTKSDFTRLSGVTRPTVDRLSYGRDKPRRHTVDAIAKAIGLNRNQARVLAGYEPPVSRHSATREAIMTDPIFTRDQRRTMLQFYDMVVGMTGGGEGGSQAPSSAPSSGASRQRREGDRAARRSA
ncbi:helix-turn-helix transcriptional regulator [Micromonospora sp. C51]|nr:helix-turn-helix transcriptional regulator [Micromonospora sp. C51]